MTESDTPEVPQTAAPAPSRAAAAPAGARAIPSSELLQGEREVVIVHQGEHYRLRLTRNDRLVLYK